MKIPKPPKPPKLKRQIQFNFSAKMPYIFIALFLAVGLSMVAFGYLLLNRQPQQSVVSGMQNEIDGLKLNYDKRKTMELFNTMYNTSDFKNSAFQGKDPFMSF